MKKKVNILIVLTLTLVSFTCSHHIQQEGRVLSNENGEPISDARVTLVSKNITVLTDSLGFFSLEHFGHGRAPRRIFHVTKEGYKDFAIEIESEVHSSFLNCQEGLCIMIWEKKTSIPIQQIYLLIFLLFHLNNTAQILQ